MTDERAERLYATWRELADRGEPIEIGFSDMRARVELALAVAVLAASLWAVLALGTLPAGVFAMVAVVLFVAGWRRLRATGPAVVVSRAGVWSSTLGVVVPWEVIDEARTPGQPTVVLLVDKQWARDNLGHLSSVRRYAIETGKDARAALSLPRHLEVPDFELGVWITARAQEGGLS